MKNPHAVALGRLGKGKKGKFSPAEIKRRSEAMTARQALIKQALKSFGKQQQKQPKEIEV